MLPSNRTFGRIIRSPRAERRNDLKAFAETLLNHETAGAALRDSSAVEKALRHIDAVFHFAAAVGIGQSMYEIEKNTRAITISAPPGFWKL